MKALSNTVIFGIAIVLITILALEISIHPDAYSQENNKKYDMILLSQNYNSTGFVDQIVGEILNNGTDTAKSVEISSVFYNDSGIIGSESTGTDPTTINPGDKSVFTLQLIDPVISSDAESYEFTLKWQDEQSVDYFTTLTGGEIPENIDDDSGIDDSEVDDSEVDDSEVDDSEVDDSEVDDSGGDGDGGDGDGGDGDGGDGDGGDGDGGDGDGGDDSDD
ncbi:MAG TPA: hypothetical protein VLE21_02085 [Candidatus Nitrosocosmicus sp.]|nr:hypothetical protein [Candidatus Nitrosocosmicus sp.]